MLMQKGTAEPGSLEILRVMPLSRMGLRCISGKGIHSMEAVMRKIDLKFLFAVLFLCDFGYFQAILVRGFGGGFNKCSPI